MMFWRGCIFVMLLYRSPRAALLCGENEAKMGVLLIAQFELGKGLRTFIWKILGAPSYEAIGAAHKSATLKF